MTRLTVYGDMKTMAMNPWRETKYGKSAMYLRAPAPWDSRKQGFDGLSDSQVRVTDAFTSASRAASAKCPKTGHISTNICRIEYIADQLKGKKY